MSVSGAAVAYGRIWRSIPASWYQPWWRATKNPVWSVFGVQSSASLTRAGVPAKDDGLFEDAGDGEPVSALADPPAGVAAEATGLVFGAEQPQASAATMPMTKSFMTRFLS